MQVALPARVLRLLLYLLIRLCARHMLIWTLCHLLMTPGSTKAEAAANGRRMDAKEHCQQPTGHTQTSLG